MKYAETLKKYRNMKKDELEKELASVKNQQTLTSLQVGAGKEDNFSQINKLRKNIARINTILMEKDYGAENER